jgi:hypothetical protein
VDAIVVSGNGGCQLRQCLRLIMPQLVSLLRQDTADQFRLFDILEELFFQPEVFLGSTFCQLAPPTRMRMLEKYYELDGLGEWGM